MRNKIMIDLKTFILKIRQKTILKEKNVYKTPLPARVYYCRNLANIRLLAFPKKNIHLKHSPKMYF